MGWTHIIAIFARTPEVSHVALCVLWVLAKTADGDGASYPSVAYIAEKAKISKRSAARGLEELRKAGLIEIESGKSACKVNSYRLADKVMNLSTSMPPSHTSSMPHSHTTDGEVCHGGIHSMPHSHTKYATVADGREPIEDTKKLSQSQCATPSAGPGAPPEEGLAKQGTERAEGTPPLAAGKEAVRAWYEEQLGTNGWKPRTRKDTEWAAWCCYQLGASAEEAKSFARFNNVRKWAAVNELTSVRQLAKEWVKVWKWRSPEAFAKERQWRKTQQSPTSNR